MKGSSKAFLVRGRRELIGSLLYISSVQYFVVQLIAASRWRQPFSWTSNAISDLGNTSCDPLTLHPVCSPAHDLMNVSFVVVGLSMLIGSLLFRRAMSGQRGTDIGFGLLQLAGVGVTLVGLFPENSGSALHKFGATLAFVLGNFALVVLGLSLNMSRWMRVLSLALALIALSALVAYILKLDGVLGSGGMERVVAYPQTLWLIAFGLYRVTLSESHSPPLNSATTS